MFIKPFSFTLVICSLTFLLRLPSLFYVFLDVDESQFAGFAHVLMNGGLPYLDSLDTKPPLIYLFYQAIFTLFGKYNMTAVHGVMILWHTLTALTLWGIGRKTGNERAGRLAAIFYVIFSTCHLPKYISVSITSVMVLPLCLSVFAWLNAENRKIFFLFVAGMLSAIAFLFKYQAGIQIVVFAVFLNCHILERRIGIKQALLHYSVYLLGFFLPIALTLGWLKHLGVFNDFVRWSLQGSAHYIGSGDQIIPFWSNLLMRGGFFVICTFLLWHLFLMQLPRVKKNIRENPHFALLLSWFALSLIPVATGGRFYGHYFLQLLPPLCLLAAYGVPSTLNAKWKGYLCIATLLPSLIFLGLRIDFRQVDAAFPDDQIFTQEKIGDWLKNYTKPQETLFVWGFASAIYFHAERAAASRFLWTDLLTGKIPGSTLSNDSTFDTSRFVRPEAWDALWEDFEKRKPDYFVDTSPANIHNYGKYPISHFPKLQNFINDNYVEMAKVEGSMIFRRKDI